MILGVNKKTDCNNIIMEFHIQNFDERKTVTMVPIRL